MPSRRHPRHGSSDADLGLILVDYDNLFETLAKRTSRGEQPHRFLLAMLAELRRYLQDELGIQATRAVAFGDFSCHEIDAGVIVNDLASSGVEARHVPSGLAATDSALSLTIHATELLFTRRDLAAFVLLSGGNWYSPLVQHLQGFGKFVLVASLDLPPNLGSLPSGVSDAFLNARFLLDSRTRDALRESAPGGADSGAARAGSAQERAPKETSEIEDEGARHALEVIEEFFGQYEEVYLTPLLRKLTETLDAEDGEPKDLVSTLQEAGAVWLEKRRGFPYDYTVLLVNAEHPDVKRVREAFAEYGGESRGDQGYDEGDDEDGEFDDSDGFDDDYEPEKDAR